MRVNRTLAIGVVLIAIVGIALFSVLRRNARQPVDLQTSESGQTSVTRILRSNSPGPDREHARMSQATKGAATHRTTQHRPGSTAAVKIVGTVRTGHELLWGAKVWLVDAERGTELGRVIADEKGSYGIRTALTTTPLTVFAVFPGYATSGLVIPAGDGSARTVQMDIELRPASFLRGRVVDPVGKPVSGVSVVASTLAAMPRQENRDRELKSMQSWDATTDGDGKFAFEDVPEGPFLVTVSDEKFVPAAMSADAPTGDLVISLKSSGVSVEGHIFSDLTGQGLPGAMVELVHVLDPQIPVAQRNWKAVSDSMGAFALAGLPEGKYNVSAEKEKLCLRPTDELLGNQIDLRTNGTTAELSLHMYAGHTITGTVTEAVHDRPLEGVRVQTAEPPVQFDTTDRDGKFRLVGLSVPSGQWLGLRVQKPGYTLENSEGDPNTALLKLASSGTEAKQDFKMRKILSVSGRVLSEGGEAIAGADVQLVNSPLEQKETESQADGSYLLQAPSGCNGRLSALARGFAPGKSDDLNLDEQSTMGVNIVLSRGIGVTGRMVDESGAGLSGLVQATALDVNERWAIGPGIVPVQTSETGEFSLTDLGVGAYWINGIRGGYSPKERTKVRLTKGHEGAGLRLVMTRSRFLAGTVVDDAGKPVERAMVHVPWDEYPTASSSQTGADGKFRLENLGADEVNLQVYIASSMREGDLESARLDHVKTNRDDVRVVVGRVVTLTLIGKVLDAKTGEPIADFDLSPEERQYYGEMFSKQGPGIFTLKDLRSGNVYGVNIIAPGYKRYRSGPRKLPPSADLPPDRRVIEEEFRLERSTSPDDQVSTVPEIEI